MHNPGAFVVFVLVSSITPGPNNLMLTTVGMTKGHRAALRTGAGVSLGWALQLALCAAGLAALVHAVPVVGSLVEVLGLAYLVWLAWKLWRTDRVGGAVPALGFRGAVAFQWINPKALTMSLTAVGLFVVRDGGRVHLASVLAVAIAAAALNYPCVAAWGLTGSSLTGVLARPGATRVFNRVAAGALLALVVWLALD